MLSFELSEWMCAGEVFSGLDGSCCLGLQNSESIVKFCKDLYNSFKSMLSYCSDKNDSLSQVKQVIDMFLWLFDQIHNHYMAVRRSWPYRFALLIGDMCFNELPTSFCYLSKIKLVKTSSWHKENWIYFLKNRVRYNLINSKFTSKIEVVYLFDPFRQSKRIWCFGLTCACKQIISKRSVGLLLSIIPCKYSPKIMKLYRYIRKLYIKRTLFIYLLLCL
jgi:hypothetical protein